MLNICVVPHPNEDRPCLTKFAHSLAACPQCGGTMSVDEGELDNVLKDMEETSKGKRSRSPKPDTESSKSASS
jgi:Zn-finger nucleic acid-binding protein